MKGSQETLLQALLDVPDFSGNVLEPRTGLRRPLGKQAQRGAQGVCIAPDLLEIPADRGDVPLECCRKLGGASA
ncbi:MAG TPA: hypothetical protein PLT21_11310, partial [Syntrophales bacterium]|nr:hypothetical protein [Syntrophales bacterium]